MRDKKRRSFLAGMGGIALGSVAPPLLRAEKRPSSVKRHALAIEGEVFQRGDEQYEQTRRNSVWQAIKPGRYPELIVKAASEEDIVRTLRYARSHGLQVAVRGGGHNYVASYLRDGGILLNISALHSLDVNREARRAHVQPGVTGAEFSARLADEGLAFPVAHGPSVAMGGYLLGGGMGWNGEHWNRFACFNVEAIDLVTAAGEALTVSHDQHPELFWAARGAGPAFCAVATGFHLRAFPLPGAIHASTYIFSIDQVAALGDWLEAARQRQDRKIELSFILESEGREKQCVLSAVCFADGKEEANALLDRLLQDIPQAGRLFSREKHPMTFAEVLALTRTSTPLRLANETAWVEDTRSALEAMTEHFEQAPPGKTVIIANYRSSTDWPEDVACSVSGPLFLNWSIRWESKKEDTRYLRWMDAVAATMEALMTGCYVNETDFIRRPHWGRMCYAQDKRARLLAIRQRYDADALLPPPFALS